MFVYGVDLTYLLPYIRMSASQDQIIEIPFSKRKLFWMFIGSLFFLILGSWIVLFPQKFGDKLYIGKTTAITAGFACIILFVFCAIYLSRRLQDKKPGLVITADCIIDNYSRVADGQIFWSDITNISFVEINRQKIILIQVRNPNDYINKQTRKFNRKLMVNNFRIYGTPVCINSNSLKIPFEELLALLTKNLVSKWQP